MSMSIVKRLDQLCVIISNPIRHVRHYTLEEIKGVIINFSSEDLYIGAKSWGNVSGKVSAAIPNKINAHSSTGEILLLTVEINRDQIDPIENMVIGTFGLQYHDRSGNNYATEKAVFQLLLIG